MAEQSARGVSWPISRPRLEAYKRSDKSYLVKSPFHEKAGRSQVVSLSFLFVTRFFSAELPTVATLPSALFDERVFSLGASWVFSFQPVLPPDCRPPVPSEMEVGPGD